jgi:Uma2 family endonuclease
MSISALQPPASRKLYRPRRKSWTRQEYERMVEAGFLGPEDRLELLEGEIVHKMLQNTPHATGIRLSEKTMNRLFGDGYDVRTQLPLALGERSEPEPDVAVVVGGPRDYARAHPTTAVLVIEIADSTLRVDRTTKAGIYARAGIPEYWIIDLNARTLLVHRQPIPMRGLPLGHYYADVAEYAETETIAPLAAPDTPIAIADLML